MDLTAAILLYDLSYPPSSGAITLFGLVLLFFFRDDTKRLAFDLGENPSETSTINWIVPGKRDALLMSNDIGEDGGQQ